MAQTSSPKREPVLFVPAPAALVKAVKIGAAYQSLTMSEYVRQAVTTRLRSEGIEPTTGART
jgi:hypothetical protein